MRGVLRPWAEDLLSPAALAESAVLDVPAARAAWEAFLSGDGRVTAMGIWALLNF